MADPIIRVEGPDGELWHDCIEAQCEVSWDGFDLKTKAPVEGRRDPPHRHTPPRGGRVRIIEIRER
jgi:hypothetical protein